MPDATHRQRTTTHAPGSAITTTAAQIAATLGETEAIPRRQIARIVRVIDPERAQACVAQAQERAAQGGLWSERAHRPRTLGGIFFYLMRGGITPRERRRIWPYQQRQVQRSTLPDTPALPVFTWEGDAATIADMIRSAEEARTVKITVIGRPGQVVERQGVMVLTMRQAKAPALPKRMPDLPPRPTNYLVFVATKQWRKVAERITNPEDVLIIEGYPTQHPQFTGITVYATQVTTKLQQQAKRQQQQEATRPASS